MTVLSIAGFALGLNTMRDRGGVALLTKVFWRFGTLVERVSENNQHLHSTFKKKVVSAFIHTSDVYLVMINIFLLLESFDKFVIVKSQSKRFETIFDASDVLAALPQF